jgi:hypothetical protein
MNLKIAPLTIKQLVSFMSCVRDEDLEEIYHATDGQRFKDVGVAHISEAQCLYDADSGDIFAIGGIEANWVWMMCTTHVMKQENQTAFLRFMRKHLEYTLRMHSFLTNYVWGGNKVHIKWLEWMGAKFKKEDTRLIHGEPFIRFYFYRD